jgi:hypothetical protein
MRSNLKFWTLAAVVAAIWFTAALIQPILVALAQQPAMGDHAPPPDHQMPDLMQQHHQQMGSPIPTMPGQAAFGAIQEIVRLLEADPNTDWSKVDLEALRQHLIDMNDVTLKANARRNRSTAVWRLPLPAKVARSRPSSAWCRLMPRSSIA